MERVYVPTARCFIGRMCRDTEDALNVLVELRMKQSLVNPVINVFEDGVKVDAISVKCEVERIAQSKA